MKETPAKSAGRYDQEKPESPEHMKKSNAYTPNIEVKRDVQSGGKSGGMEIIEVDNGRLRIAILPERGMGIWKIWVDEIEVGWKSPVRGPVHPMYVPLFEPGGLGWLEGFDEALCRCGLTSNGAPEFDSDGKLVYPLHGRIANLPAQDVAVSTGEASGTISVSGSVHESSFYGSNLVLNSKISLGRGALSFDVCDSVTNLASAPAIIQLIYHYNLGAPILGENATFVAPVRSVLPRDAEATSGMSHWSNFSAPTPDFREQVYYSELRADSAGNTTVLLKSSDSTMGASVEFNVVQLPCFTLWKNTGGLSGGFVAGLEPGTNYPNSRAKEVNAGRYICLAQNETAEFNLRFAFHTSSSEVKEIERKIQKTIMR
jgi:Domain of unknown function (DUF4432)